MSTTWEDVKPWIAKVAPMLGAALGGPLGGAAGALVSSALGVKDASPDSIKAAIQNGTLTGDQLVGLKASEQNFMLQCKQLDITSAEQLADLEFKDRDSARKREVDAHDSWTPRILAGIIVGGFLGCVYFVLSGRVKGLLDPGVATMIGTLIGYVSAKADQVYSYYFGSNAGSKIKDQMLYNSSPAKG